MKMRTRWALALAAAHNNTAQRQPVQLNSCLHTRIVPSASAETPIRFRKFFVTCGYLLAFPQPCPHHLFPLDHLRCQQIAVRKALADSRIYTHRLAERSQGMSSAQHTAIELERPLTDATDVGPDDNRHTVRRRPLICIQFLSGRSFRSGGVAYACPCVSTMANSCFCCTTSPKSSNRLHKPNPSQGEVGCLASPAHRRIWLLELR
jgi:hypothetical protein